MVPVNTLLGADIPPFNSLDTSAASCDYDRKGGVGRAIDGKK